MNVNADPMKKLMAEEMAKALGNCKTCRHAEVTLDGCKQRRIEFYHRFDRECEYHEHDHNWCG